jgi:acylphosphatase
MNPSAWRLRITGRVQGVGYRASLAAEANRLGLAGWVRNRRDGSVEAVIDGPIASMQGLLDWARTGPPMAQVDDVAVTQEKAGTQEKGFWILPDA